MRNQIVVNLAIVILKRLFLRSYGVKTLIGAIKHLSLHTITTNAPWDCALSVYSAFKCSSKIPLPEAGAAGQLVVTRSDAFPRATNREVYWAPLAAASFTENEKNLLVDNEGTKGS